MGQVTERATRTATARNGGGDASGGDRKGGGGAGRARCALQRRNFCKSCRPPLSAARRPAVFSLSQPCFNCRFIFRQTGCLPRRLSASRALGENRGSAAPPQGQQEASQRSEKPAGAARSPEGRGQPAQPRGDDPLPASAGRAPRTGWAPETPRRLQIPWALQAEAPLSSQARLMRTLWESRLRGKAHGWAQV